MKITVKYFASLREQLQRDEQQVELDAGVSTLADLRQWLCQQGEPWASAMDDGRPLMTAINETLANPDAPLNEGDVVAFFPRVTGG